MMLSIKRQEIVIEKKGSQPILRKLTANFEKAEKIK